MLAQRYSIESQLGSGGMGDVYVAFDASLRRRVAIKTLRRELASDPQMFARFRQEAEAAAGLGHPNIVQIIEFRCGPGEPPLLVMELLEGTSLRTLLGKEGRLAAPRAAFIGMQVLSALAAAHRARIVHRDIKPANIFIVHTLAVADFVKVLDFGVAKLLDRTGAGAGGALTELGDVLGTTAYMAPEQALGIPIDARADLFSVGMVLFEVLAGARPREANRGDLRAAAFTPCRKLAEAAPWVPRGLAAVVDEALMLDPAARFDSAEAMAAALAPYAQSSGLPQDVTLLEPRSGELAAAGPVTVSTREHLSLATAPSAPPTMGATSGRPPGPAALVVVTTPSSAVAVASLSQQAVRAAVPSPSPSWWIIPVVVLFGVGLVGAAFTSCIVYANREIEREELALLASRPLEPCTSPRECLPPQRYDDLVYGGVSYGACVQPSPAPPETLPKDAIVFLTTDAFTRSARVVSMPNEGSYLVERADQTTEVVPRGKVAGRACVRKK